MRCFKHRSDDLKGVNVLSETIALSAIGTHCHLSPPRRCDGHRFGSARTTLPCGSTLAGMTMHLTSTYCT